MEALEVTEGKVKANRKRLVVWALILTAFATVWVFAGFFAALLVLLFLAALALGVESRIPLAASIILLGSCPFMLLFGQKAAAETLAEWAYYFLAVGVVLLLVDYFRKEPSADREGDA